MENAQIAQALSDYADLLEIDGANPFRILAWRNAARSVAEHPMPLRAWIESGHDPRSIPGVGKEIAASIQEMVSTGRWEAYAALSTRVPPTLIRVTQLPGLGPKRTKRLFEELGVRSIEDLEREARAGGVAALSGFGPRTAQRILVGIEAQRRSEGRVRRIDAERLAAALVAHLREAPGLERVEEAGGLRRKAETVTGLDLVASTRDPDALVARFTAAPGVEQVLAADRTRVRVRLVSGVGADLRVATRDAFGAAWIEATGSEAHAERLRAHARERGLLLSATGVYRRAIAGRNGEAASDKAASDGDTGGPDGPERDLRIAGDTEASVFEALGLEWIPPELREDRGEIEVALETRLPRLLRLEEIRGDLQMHSTWSDGKVSIEEMLEACVALGYDYFAVTDHSPSLTIARGLDPDRLRRQWEEIREIAARHPEIRILRGMEVDILGDGSLDLDDALLAELDLVLASVHSRMDLPLAEQTERVLRAVRHPMVDILAHPTARNLTGREPIRLDMDAILEAAAEHRTAVELNAHPNRLDLNDLHLMDARRRGVAVVISTDAHNPRELSYMRYGVDQARRAWLTAEDVLNTRPIDDLLAGLKPKPGRAGRP